MSGDFHVKTEGGVWLDLVDSDTFERPSDAINSLEVPSEDGADWWNR